VPGFRLVHEFSDMGDYGKRGGTRGFADIEDTVHINLNPESKY